jgi:hypothetical protein
MTEDFRHVKEKGHANVGLRVLSMDRFSSKTDERMEMFFPKWSEKPYTKNEKTFQLHPSFLHNITPVASRTRGERRHEDCRKV